MLYDTDDGDMASFSLIVDPERKIPQEVIDIHGINNRIATSYGVSALVAISMFNNFLKKCDVLVAHNIGFDMFVLQCEYIRYKKPVAQLVKSEQICTMKSSINIVNLPPNPGYNTPKWPSLEETCRFFFKKNHPIIKELESSAHDAMTDVRACAGVFRELEKGGYLK